MDKRPIGIFDSGIGGLTVAKEIFACLPREDIVYFGDTARVPYGTKSPQTVKKFSCSNTKFLMSQKVKIVIVACNTASATSFGKLRAEFPSIPIIGVIGPAVKLALMCTKNKKIGVIGTESTISSNAYLKEIRKFKSNVSLFGQSCPLFVPLVEEGWIDRKETLLIAKKYLTPLKRKKIDALILGCTHYPMLKSVIKKIMGKGVAVIDSARAVAEKCKKVLEEKGLFNGKKRNGWHKFFVSDNPLRFKRAGQKFLGRKIDKVAQIDIG
ncbi:glutamate racemase [Candidatus Desantisbacteria bacterium CG1_02_38_46]|uniref:Glutamate racemase n=3 Tax=unclassified Candidatus Desantisiibacteriota TaxID=3106372 RepID=A0A2H9PBB4_9BACT|nr:MAG: glutamate racemase [Candidatus Desantisbacteria bacterium CG1_02_38_46]PIU51212.1 MAG: glutamate racemase [Candidatus Desantisbacteria bacterium CG07_land_8_20_14_0_80_39_15]PIZ16041.1 MAG: glutamate racemase [Candidatus Desantisbacteria bacterium CG_4_10_14_0_8_um_filter_39_17]